MNSDRIRLMMVAVLSQIGATRWIYFFIAGIGAAGAALGLQLVRRYSKFANLDENIPPAPPLVLWIISGIAFSIAVYRTDKILSALIIGATIFGPAWRLFNK